MLGGRAGVAEERHVGNHAGQVIGKRGKPHRRALRVHRRADVRRSQGGARLGEHCRIRAVPYQRGDLRVLAGCLLAGCLRHEKPPPGWASTGR